VKRRIVGLILALAIGSGAEWNLIQAATATPDRLPARAAAVAPDGVLGAVAGLEDIACLRGAAACFGYGSDDCCGEMATLGAVAGAVGAWLAAGVAAWYFYSYC
jgi:hypothetical protein